MPPLAVPSHRLNPREPFAASVCVVRPVAGRRPQCPNTAACSWSNERPAADMFEPPAAHACSTSWGVEERIGKGASPILFHAERIRVIVELFLLRHHRSF